MASQPDPRYNSAPVSSLSQSPGRLSRPGWPWVPVGHHRPSSAGSFSGSNSNTNLLSSPSITGAESLHLTSIGAASPSFIQSSRRYAYSAPMLHDGTTREWGFTAFEWTVKDVVNLKQAAESGDGTTLDAFQVLKESPLIGDGKYKVEIACTPTETASDVEIEGDVQRRSTLSLYITSLMIDFAHTDFEMSGSIMAAIKCMDGHAGERATKVEWLWEHWEKDFVFRQGSEVWHCALPTLSKLLENPRVARTNSFVLCLQIHSPVGPFFPHQPAARYVPRELLEGLEASLDNSNTGDVKFVCLERKPILPPSPSDPSRRSVSSSSSSMMQSTSNFAFRKRVIWAHRDVLIRRSEYFATMLDSSFNESTSTTGERRVYTITVEHAEFSTVYWLLKWIYGNWVLFDAESDPRMAIEGVPENWNTFWPPNHPREWAWKVYVGHGFLDEEVPPTKDDESSSVGSSASHLSERNAATVEGKRKSGYMPPTMMLQTMEQSGTQMSGTTSVANRGGHVTPAFRRPSADTKALASSIPTSKSLIASPPSNRPIATSQAQYPVSPRQSRQPLYPIPIPLADPNPHPTPPPSGAAALAIYQVAHRYELPPLQNLALEHIVNGLTTENCFPMLLASYLWEELHNLVEDYVVQHWDAVSASSIFNISCEQVALGEWGSEGGKTLVALFRRLKSPI